MPFEQFLAGKALDARIDKEMPKTVPIPANEANYVAAAELYKQHCAVCHGLPLAGKSAIANGMYPAPPRLLEGKGVTDDPAGESYWKVFNGIRLTGMPGFGKSLSETQMWQVALLVANADKLPTSAKEALVAPMGGNAPAQTMPNVVPVPPPPTLPASTPAQK
jgi:thiosulfate dehydrogenase